MESGDGVAEIDRLERGLLLHEAGTDIDDQDPVLYAASFEESEENFVNYQTAYWVLYSLLLVLAWGFGLFMLIYLPLRRYILRKDIRSRKLSVTPNAIVYKPYIIRSMVLGYSSGLSKVDLIAAVGLVSMSIWRWNMRSVGYTVRGNLSSRVRKPVAFPCFGFLEKEKYVLLPSVADVVIEQGYLQSLFGVYSVRIESVGVRRPASDDVKIQGVPNPLAFRKVVLSHLSNMRDEVFSRQASTIEEVSTPKIGHSSVALMSSPSKSPGFDYFSQLGDTTILKKLEEVRSSVKRVQALIEEQNPQAQASAD